MQESEKQFTVYKSSAGSGKTFTLVKEYLRIALSDTFDPPQRYKKILAITFTNKAAAEMKERIISALKELADPKAGINSPLAIILKEELKLDAFTLAVRSKDLLRAILHNYTDFAIGTIDSFTHRIIRAFSHDLNLPVNFEVEMDSEKLIREAVDILISKIGVDDKLTEILVKFSETKTEEEKTWQIENELRYAAKNLLKEDAARSADKLRELSIDDFMNIASKLHKMKIAFEENVGKIAKSAIKLIQNSGLSIDDFSYTKAGIAGRLLAYANNDLEKFGEPNKNIEKSIASGKWNSGTATKDAKAIIETIKFELETYWKQLEEIVEHEFPTYVFRKMLRKNIYSIAVLSEIEKIIFNFRNEQNILHISEFNRIISKVVFAEPVPFIYERLGEKYSNYLIDEFQDTSLVQWHNLLPLIENSLAGNHFNMLVGDGKQAIYRWRGGEVSQFANLPKVINHLDNPLITEREQSLVRNYEPRHLSKNYRSKAEIIQFNNAFFRNLSEQLSDSGKLIYDQLEQEFDPTNTGGYVRIESLNLEKDNKSEPFVEKTIALVQQLAKEDWPLSEIAILVKTNKDGSLIATNLLKAGIPVLSSESLLLKQSPIVSFMVSILRCIDHPAEELAGAQVLEYLVASKKISGPLHERLKQFGDHRNNLKSFLAEHKITFDPIRFARLPFYQRCEEIITCFGLGEKSDSYLLFFLDEILNYSNSRNKDKQDFFAWWEDRSRKASVVVPEGMNAVTIMTIHKSKGLEFPVVIFPFANWKPIGKPDEKWIDFEDPEIPGLTTALIPITKDLMKTNFKSVYEEEQDKLMLDDINVLYVAMTRAEKRLYVFTEDISLRKSEPTGVSPFFPRALNAMKNPFVENISETGKIVPPELSKVIPPECISPDNLESHIWENRVRIRSNSSDHWDADDANGSRDKGNLLHEILSEINTKEDIDFALENAILNGLSGSSERDSIKTLLNKLIDLPELSSCFNGKGKIRKETELLLPNGKRLRPDRVIENSEETIIIDYKTGQANPSYKKQLDRYAEVLKEMGYGKIQKKIVYTETLTVESWN